MTDILIPELSENIHSGTVTKVSVKIGDVVAKGQTLFELETDKAVLEVPATSGGTVAEILIKTGEKVKKGQVAFRFNDGGAVAAPAPSLAAAPAKTPAITEAVASKPAPVTAATAPAVSVQTPAPASNNSDIAASPSVRRLARELGVNIAEVPASGPNQRISVDDVTAYAKKLITTRSASAPAGTPGITLPDFSKWGEINREGLSAIRQKTAEHMAACWSTVPHVTQFAKTDITEVDKVRQKSSTNELKLTITPFIIKVVASALKHFPVFNASIDMNTREIVYKKYYNIGVAVDTDNGLLVPVIRNADKKSILELAQEIKVLADKARARKLTLDDMQGGTFTITNLGGITNGHFTPIVNAPESAILGLSRANLEPCCTNGTICTPRLMLPLSLSYDHRLINGADGARFVKWISDAVEQPLLLEL
jgi:pyruvate dehydrogenase E2 component (dihydrolipoamide acetyltransferase)